MLEEFAIICDAQKGQDLGIEILALVDRKFTGGRWWTSDEPGIILKFHKKSAAEYVLGCLEKNNPRIIDYKEAWELIDEQRDRINEASTENEVGWDAHFTWWYDEYLQKPGAKSMSTFEIAQAAWNEAVKRMGGE